MSRKRTIGGYIYPSQQSVLWTVAEWQTMMRAEIAKGGFRRYEKTVGETFIHAAPPHPVILAEIYGNVPQPEEGAEDAS